MIDKTLNDALKKPAKKNGQIVWSTKTISLKELSPAKYNPRKWSDDAIAGLTKSIDKFNLADPLVINKNNTIIGGHFRYKILKDKGLLEADVRIPSRLLSEDEEKELNLRLNKNLGDWDYSSLSAFSEEMLEDVGFDSAELDKIFQQESKPSDDDVPENAPTIAKTGDIFQLGIHRIMCGDSTNRDDVEKLMAGNKADMVFTDPPYGVSYADKNKYLNSIARGNRIQTPIENDHKTIEETRDTLIYPSFCCIKEFLADKASYYITAPQGGDLLMMMMMMMKAGLTLRHMLIWVKNNHVLGRTDYNYKHEPILFGWVNGHNFYGNGEFQFSTWEINKPNSSKLHPTMKPIALIVNALQNSTKREDIVMDLFLGSGSTLIACEKTNRRCYGMEIDPHYIDIIIKRWEDFTGQKAKKI